jgi:hypothetical protein
MDGTKNARTVVAETAAVRNNRLSTGGSFVGVLLNEEDYLVCMNPSSKDDSKSNQETQAFDPLLVHEEEVVRGKCHG